MRARSAEIGASAVSPTLVPVTPDPPHLGSGGDGDIHLEPDHGRFRPAFEQAAGEAGVLLLAGDLTRHGTAREAEAVAEEVRGLGIPVIAVLGNHGYHSDCEDNVAEILEEAGVQVLEGNGTVVNVDGVCIGIAGTKGFATGFPGKQASEFEEGEMKSFVRHSRDLAERFGLALRGLDCGFTPGGVRVRNVARPLIGCAYAVSELTAREAQRVSS